MGRSARNVKEKTEPHNEPCDNHREPPDVRTNVPKLGEIIMYAHLSLSWSYSSINAYRSRDRKDDSERKSTFARTRSH